MIKAQFVYAAILLVVNAIKIQTKEQITSGFLQEPRILKLPIEKVKV